MTEQVTRFDSAPLPANVRELPSGGLLIPASVARTGLQEYRDAKGNTIVEYRPSEEVFSQETLDSLLAAPVTLSHPKQFVNAATWAILAQGSVAKVSETPERMDDGEQYVNSVLSVNRADAVRRVLAREVEEVSLGYTCRIDKTPGVLPDGRKYDQVQRDIRINHVAVLPVGEKARAGKRARLRLDGNDNLMMDDEEQHMPDDSKERNDALEAAVKRADKLEADIKARDTELAKANARVDAAEKELNELKEGEAARIDAEVQFRSQLSKYLPADHKFTGSRTDARKAALKHLGDTTELEGRSDEYVEAWFEAKADSLLAAAKKPAGSKEKFDYNKTTKTTKADSTPKDLSDALIEKANRLAKESK